MADDKKSFVLYADLIHTINKLSKEQAGQLFKLILEFVNGIETEINDLLIELVFEPIKQDLIQQRKKSQQGEYHWNWKGGISPENHRIRTGTRIKDWRKEVFKRDDYTCQHCKKRGGKIHAHHIKPFAVFIELRFEVNNGLTLCKKCHNNVHKKGVVRG